MYKNKSIGVVVPAYNEQLLIGRVISTMPDYVDKIIVVDDVSTDDTGKVVQSLENPKLIYIRHPENQGVGGAIVTGYKRAIEENLDIIAVMAGDAQMDPGELEDILNPVIDGIADYSKGNRLFSGETWKIMPKYRYIGNSFLSMMTKMASGYWHVADSQTGYAAISKKALKALDLDCLFKRYGFPNDMLVHLNINNFTVVDVPISSIYNIGEKSGIKVHRVVPRLVYLLTNRFFKRMFHKYIIRDFHPLIFFYFFGAIIFTTGLVLGIVETYIKLTTGKIALPSIILVAILIISGLQLLLFGMLFDMEYNKSLRN